MDFYIGQEVMIHPNLRNFDRHESPTINVEMMGLAGRVVHVSSFDGRIMTLQENDWMWLPKWLIPLDEVQEDIQIPNMDEIL